MLTSVPHHCTKLALVLELGVYRLQQQRPVLHLGRNQRGGKAARGNGSDLSTATGRSYREASGTYYRFVLPSDRASLLPSDRGISYQATVDNSGCPQLRW